MSSTGEFRSIGWTSWNTKQDRPQGTHGGSSTPARKPSIFETENKAAAYGQGDSIREVFIRVS